MMIAETDLQPECFLGFDLPLPGPDGLTGTQRAWLVDAMQTARLDWAAFGDRIVFTPGHYSRTKLFRDEEWEVLLLSWLPGQITPVHDHGSSWGATLVIAGALTEARYRAPGGPLELIEERTVPPPTVLIETVDVIHRLGNQSDYPALSLHLYTTPLKDPGIYDVATGLRQPWLLPTTTS